MPPDRLFTRSEMPDSLFAIDHLNLANELLEDPLDEDWFQLGASSLLRVEAENARVVIRKCFLIRPKLISRAFAGLNYIGNSIHDLGLPSVYTIHDPSGSETHGYRPTHEFELHEGIRVEPLVSERAGERSPLFLINPDLWLQLGLEETNSGSAVWMESRSGTEVLRQRTAANQVRVVEILRNYLLKYLRDRQRALVVGHWADARIDQPTQDERARFEAGSVELQRTRPYRAKVLINSAAIDGAFSRRGGFLYRQMHLWFCVRPPELNTLQPWREEPTFDIQAFTLPTSDGEVAPARFRSSGKSDSRAFAGVSGHFMTPVFFRQEVLERYQDSAMFTVDDDGAVHCGHFWGLYRSTHLYGNEYISTAIGDFAEGVPYDEWQHWRQYAIPAPGRGSLGAAASEPRIAVAVTNLVEALRTLNRAFVVANFEIGIDAARLWDGDVASLAGRRLKRHYRNDAADDVFLERATLLATLVTDELRAAAIRPFLQHFGPALHLSFAKLV